MRTVYSSGPIFFLVVFFLTTHLAFGQNNTITVGRQFNFWNLHAKNIQGSSQNINLSDKRTGAEVAYMLGYQRNLKADWGVWLNASFGVSFGPTEEFRINPPIQLSADQTFEGLHMSSSQAAFLQLSSGASKKFRIAKHLRIATSAGIGRQWHDAAVDHELSTVFTDPNDELRTFKYGQLKGKNPDTMPFYLLGGLDIILFEGNFNIIFGGQFQYFLSDIYRIEALTVLDGNGFEHTLSYDNSGIGWLMNLRASYSF